MMESEGFSDEAIGFVVPGHDWRKAPIVSPPVVLFELLMEIGVIIRYHDWIFVLGRVTSHPFLVVNLSGIDRTCILGSCLILALILDHVILDGSGEISRHKSLWVALAVFGEEELAEADSRRDFPLKTELDQIDSVESWECWVTLVDFAIDEVFTKLNPESVSH